MGGEDSLLQSIATIACKAEKALKKAIEEYNDMKTEERIDRLAEACTFLHEINDLVLTSPLHFATYSPFSYLISISETPYPFLYFMKEGRLGLNYTPLTHVHIASSSTPTITLDAFAPLSSIIIGDIYDVLTKMTAFVGFLKALPAMIEAMEEEVKRVRRKCKVLEEAYEMLMEKVSAILVAEAI